MRVADTELFDGLQQAITRRTAAEENFAERFRSGPDEEIFRLTQSIDALESQHAAARAETIAEYEATRAQLVEHYQTGLFELDRHHERSVREIRSRYAGESTEAERQYKDSTWVTSSVLDDTAEDSPHRQFETFRLLLQRTREEHEASWTQLATEYAAVAEVRGLPELPEPLPVQERLTRDQAHERFREEIETGHEQLAQLQKLWLPKLFLGWRPLILILLVALGLTAAALAIVTPEMVGVSINRTEPIWFAILAGASAGTGLMLFAVLYAIAMTRQSDVLQSVHDAVAAAQGLQQFWNHYSQADLARQEKTYRRDQARIEQQRAETLRRYENAHSERMAEIERRREDELQTENDAWQQQREALVAERDRSLTTLDEEHAERLDQNEMLHLSEKQRIENEVETLRADRQAAEEAAWSSLQQDWESATRHFFAATDEAAQHRRSTYPKWEELLEPNWLPPEAIPAGIPLGTLPIDLNHWPDAVPEDASLAPHRLQTEWPLALPFPDRFSLLLKGSGARARSALQLVLQSVMLRLLTLLPPGKVRFTIIDPVGLGESFAGFMHLADYDELLVTSRIWTESGHIEARLADLTEHMENVLQKYLRNEFATIEQYNEFAGEVAEPYRFLVITDFPSRFTEIAARRLKSIVTSGPRCGVYTLLGVDPTGQWPPGLSLADLEEQMQTFAWKAEAFHPAPASMSRWPVRIDAPPPPEQFTTIVKRVGEVSRDARRVEVAFDRIAPNPGDYWTSDSRSGIDVPLGRAGATKLQHLRLGKGTSQHMLVAGKTGSGKSTFLHALVTNLALHYSPDEIRFYLIDFKKGVEFKQYATSHLAHADVIAIESDREFGVSALQRLDEVLNERGETFRRHGVQDIAAFRNTVPDVPMPRILLVVDEFQEYFTEDDKLSQQATLLLDRLVRQGRAFGIHVILGSQTLGGAYSLARSTLGQVAVRVALQCSEADAHLILSEENTAARLLTRPGEAIYNDANGMLEGNHPFQIAWLPDEQREQLLSDLASLAGRRGIEVEPAIVFEGNVLSDPARNGDLVRLLEGTDDSPQAAVPRIWLGEAVEIRPATGLPFQRQSGSNLLLVGQDPEAALGVMTNAFATLAGQLSTTGKERTSADDSDTLPQSAQPSTAPAAQLYLFDGSSPDEPSAAAWRRLTGMFPRGVRLVRPREAATAIDELATLLDQRDADPDHAAAPVFLIIHHLSRFRDLRKAEDDFGMGSFGSMGESKPPQPGTQFAKILADGPANGIHSLIWCDSYNNIDRWFSRQTLRELEYRVAFQMNATDSSNLIDSPAASRLGPNRALLYREETGTSEKFRPYTVPDEAWLRSLHDRRTQVPIETAIDPDEFRIL
ncbi:FtsK-like domain-containing protein [Maioricimonas rarisocia]|uniref:FtsK-like domain-containing protein n=1 Tax=Maioricimonas rarisocia TaxID=2528026 RepID=A0A517Z256_9PLAN|nr:FtsK/SpoIIIE domain-containing protein [Maioricimonas rarisocia]QDU36557.1 FtsK-like domain-containing protein [Maioricimonas rarisocia]